MIENILDFRRSGSWFSYGDLITKITIHAEVSLEGEERDSSIFEIGLRNINKSKAFKRIEERVYALNAHANLTPQAPQIYKQQEQ